MQTRDLILTIEFVREFPLAAIPPRAAANAVLSNANGVDFGNSTPGDSLLGLPELLDAQRMRRYGMKWED